MNELKFNFGANERDEPRERDDLRAVWGEAAIRSVVKPTVMPEMGPTVRPIVTKTEKQVELPVGPARRPMTRPVEKLDKDKYGPKKYERYANTTLSDYRPAFLKEYGEDRTEENLRMLEIVSNPQMVELYKKVLEENPQLCVVKLVNEDLKSNSFFSWASRDKVTGQILPTIRFNFAHPETYSFNVAETWGSIPDEKVERQGARFSMKRLALKMGADWRKCVRNKKLAASALFLHEMGHAHDFIDNYLAPAYMEETGLPERMRMSDSMIRAVSRASNRLGQDIALYRTRQSSPIEKHIAYREMSSEKVADDFAVDYLLEHHDEYFEEEGATSELKSLKERAFEVVKGSPWDEKVKVAFGKEIPMDKDFAHIMGLTVGNEIRVEPVLKPVPGAGQYDMHEGDYGIYGYEAAKRFDEDGNYMPRHSHPASYVGKHETPVVEGKLMATLEDRGSIYLRTRENATRVCNNASCFRYVPSRDPETGEVTTQVYFNDESSLLYKVDRVAG